MLHALNPLALKLCRSQNRAAVLWSFFSGFIHFVYLIISALLLARVSFGLCLQAGHLIFYFLFFAPVLYRALLIDSHFVTGGHLWDSKVQALVIPSNLLYDRKKVLGAGADGS
jgi:hypothetical protein